MEKGPDSERVKFFIDQVHTHSKGKLPKQVDEMIALYSRQIISKPIVFIGITSSSVVAGALDTLKAIEDYIKETDINIEIVIVGSIGLCSLEPIVDIQLPGKCRVAFQQVTADLVAQILDGVLNNYLPSENVLAQYRSLLHQPWLNVPFFDELAFFNSQQRVLLEKCGVISPQSIVDSLAFGGYKAFTNVIKSHIHSEVCSIIEKSGLRGRGGGGYSTGVKWKKTLEAAADQKYFICNADESDPGAFLDRLLMESDPHLVIEGIAISSYAIGASKAIIYTRNRYALTVQRIENAVREAYSAGFLGHNILNSGYNLDLTIRKGPGAYVCGEETALIQSIEGKRGTPILKPPYPVTRGLFGKPTVVNNVETIANVPHIINRGYEWFRSIGTHNSKGTKLFSVSGMVKSTCVVEVPFGVSIAKIVELAGGVNKGRMLKAIHIGGPSGFCTTPDFLNTPIDYELIKEKGLTLGSGGILVFDDTVCVIDMVKYFMNFVHKESCGKCIPCREGSRRMLEILDSITRRPVTDDGHSTLERFKGIIHLESIAQVMRDTSLCGLGKTAPNPTLSSLKCFRDEFDEHIFDRKCTASVCRDLRSYYIDVDKCTGCDVCAKKCPTNAIIGTPRSPYFIVEEKCIGCGVCEEVCKFSAVFFK
jgi:NADH:ubiquinone oxidoreductase subunit F (NADH-binding)